jgi:hypothetical protein
LIRVNSPLWQRGKFGCVVSVLFRRRLLD